MLRSHSSRATVMFAPAGDFWARSQYNRLSLSRLHVQVTRTDLSRCCANSTFVSSNLGPIQSPEPSGRWRWYSVTRSDAMSNSPTPPIDLVPGDHDAATHTFDARDGHRGQEVRKSRVLRRPCHQAVCVCWSRAPTWCRGRAVVVVLLYLVVSR